jgi:photosystem II stability/assembly factor-like uncharacterized protein
MKLLSAASMLSIIILLSVASCKKETQSVFPETLTDSIPFENNDIKIEFAGSLPFALNASVTDLHFFDALKGIAITNAGEIYKTTDGGISWSRKYASADSIRLHQVLFTNNTTGYVVGGNISCSGNGCISPGGIILKTIDEGNTWNEVFNEPATDLVSIAENSKKELFAVGNGVKNQIFKSIDSGNNWAATTVSDQNFYKIVFNDGYGFCTSTSTSKLLRSTDDGLTWNLYSAFTTLVTTDIKFNDGIGFCIGGPGVYKTIDNGDTWRETIAGTGPYVVKPLTANSCLAFGTGEYTGGDFGHFYGAIWQTNNGGNSWTNVQFTNVSGFICADFYSPTNGYAPASDKLLKITIK